MSEVVAASSDGRSFTFWSEGSAGLGAGDMVVVHAPDAVTVPGQVLDVSRATTGFVQGEALLAGGFAPVPMLVQMRERLTAQGGSDVAVPLVDPTG